MGWEGAAFNLFDISKQTWNEIRFSQAMKRVGSFSFERFFKASM
jgi:hypothetical protein